ncbi:Endoglucanase [Paenibacillus mucilaginosus KNP414]|uniref:Endoglucanase n=2 Tax=Paenibacillus mucilaginosus TaxID=61624 RepID=F8FIX7_PAEMK|nr:Endoglucanase [Paenibacillus mucilaginosus KNP414]
MKPSAAAQKSFRQGPYADSRNNIPIREVEFITMKALNRKILAGTLLTSVVFGSAPILHNEAFAATSTSSVQAGVKAGMQSGQRGPQGGFGFAGSDVTAETAVLLGVEESVITAALQEGQTLVEIAAAYGFSEEDYLEGLTAALTAKINAEHTAGTLTDEQAENMKTQLPERLKSQAAGEFDDAAGTAEGGRGIGMGANLTAYAAEVLGVAESTITAAMKEGRTLAVFAEAQGMSAEDFHAAVTAALTAEIEAKLEDGTFTEAQAEEQKSALSNRVKRQIEGQGGVRPDTSGEVQEPGTAAGQAKGSAAKLNGAAQVGQVELTDIGSHWAVGSIRNLVKKGILQGDDNQRFNPDNTVTREELATMVTRSFNLSAEASAESRDYADVDQNRWSYKDIEASREFFDVKSDASGKASFQPSAGAKREDVAVTLVKVLLKQNPSMNLLSETEADELLKSRFKDADSIPAELRPYIATAVKSELIQGDDEGNFAPSKTITRAEVAALLARLLGEEETE